MTTVVAPLIVVGDRVRCSTGRTGRVVKVWTRPGCASRFYVRWDDGTRTYRLADALQVVGG